jgi:ankyrin repeat protein
MFRRLYFRLQPLAFSLFFLLLPFLSLQAADSAKETLQKGLFEEEANRNLEAAAQAYRSVISGYDQNRQLAATAVFRLAECYRKLGKTNEARVQYQRIVQEFPDQTALADLSRKQTGAVTITVKSIDTASSPNTLPTSTEADELRRIQLLVKDSPDLLNMFPKDKGTVPLMDAAINGQLRVAEFLLNNGANVNLQYADVGRTPLHYAAENGHRAMVELLLKRGAEVNRTAKDRDGRGSTALHYAARQGFKTVAEVLLAHGADINARDNSGISPLHTAVREDNAAMVDFLIANQADAEIRDRSGLTPLLTAAKNAQVNIARVLIQRGANPNVRLTVTNLTDAGSTPLLLALNNEFADRLKYRPMIELLITNRADVNQAASNGLTPLMNAAYQDDISTLTLLTTAGANLDAVDLERRSALFHAALGNKTNAIEFLLSRKVNPDARGPYGLTAMHVAATRSYTDDALSLLLEHKANIDAQDDFGCTPLHYAAHYSKKTAIAFLISRRADPGIRNQKGLTPYAMSSGENAGAAPSTEVLNVFYPRSPGVPQGIFAPPPRPMPVPPGGVVDPRQETTQMLLRYTREREAMLVPREPQKK